MTEIIAVLSGLPQGDSSGAPQPSALTADPLAATLALLGILVSVALLVHSESLRTFAKERYELSPRGGAGKRTARALVSGPTLCGLLGGLCVFLFYCVVSSRQEPESVHALVASISPIAIALGAMPLAFGALLNYWHARLLFSLISLPGEKDAASAAVVVPIVGTVLSIASSILSIAKVVATW